MKAHNQILNNLRLNEGKEEWYYLCNDAEQALLKVRAECKDNRAISTIEKMIIELNSIRMEQYEALTEYSLNEEFWEDAGEKEYKGIKISIEKGDHGNTCYIPLRNKELNFIPKGGTQFFSYKEVKEYIDKELGKNNLKEENKLNLKVGDEVEFYSTGYKDNGKFSNKPNILMKTTVKKVNDDGSISCKDPQGVKDFDYISPDEIISVNGKKLNESFEGNFEGKKITTNLHNDKDNPIWIIGDISINDNIYRVNAKVYQEGSEFGIDNGPISKLYIADKEDNCVVNYDRGWDIKPTPEYEEIYNITIGAVKSFRNSNPYETDDSVPEESINESSIKEQNNSIEYATPCYTGGGVYIYTGKLKDGNYFLGSDDWFSEQNNYFTFRIVNEDPDKFPEDCLFDDWQTEHLVKDLSLEENKSFTKEVLNWVINNKPEGNYQISDMEGLLNIVNK